LLTVGDGDIADVRRDREDVLMQITHRGATVQQVRCSTALVSLLALLSMPIACAVGSTTRSTLRRRASSLTCVMTGNAPSAPVPITSRRHRQGMSSAADSGVCPQALRNVRDAAFFR